MWGEIWKILGFPGGQEREKDKCSVLTPNLPQKARKKRGPYKKRKRAGAKGAKIEDAMARESREIDEMRRDVA